MDKKTCFIICPISDENSTTRKRSDRLLENIIDPVLENCGFESAIRIDRVSYSDSITQKIMDYIIKSDLVIADLTEHNPNCFYEMGYRKALNKPIIHLKEQNEKIPFDIYDINTISYGFYIDEVKTAIEKLESTIKIITFDKLIEEETNSDNVLTELKNILIRMESKFELLNKKLDNYNTETLSALGTAIAQNVKPKTQDEIVFENLIPTLMEKPENIETFLRLAELGNKMKSSK